MFIKTDNDNNIIQLISVGTKPTENGYEIADDTPKEIVQNIFDYKYIEGKFVKRDESDQRKLEIIRDAKINNMRDTCNAVIEKGIDYDGEHYSLEQTDQINLMKLESVAMTQPDAIIFYHSDGQLCRQYTASEIIGIAQLSVQYITYHTTYFNFMKSQISNMTSIDDIIAMNYGMKLDEVYQSQLDAFSSGLGFVMEEVVDTFDYDKLIVAIDVDALIIKDMTPSEDETNDYDEEENNEPTTPPEESGEEKVVVDQIIPDEESGEVTDETEEGNAEELPV